MIPADGERIASPSPETKKKPSGKEILELFNRLTARLKHLEEQNTELEHQNKELEQQNTELERRCDELASRNRDLVLQLDRAGEQLATLRRETAQASATVLDPAPAAPSSIEPRPLHQPIPPPRPAVPLAFESVAMLRLPPPIAERPPQSVGASTDAGQPWPAGAPRRRLPSPRHLLFWMLIALLHAATAAVFVTNLDPGTAAALWSFPIDDAYIHLDYARQLATTGVFGYNDGLWEAGSTSPLWVFILAIAYRLFVMNGLSAVIVVKVVGLAFAIGTSAVIYALVRRISGRSFLAALAALVIAVEPTFSFHKVSGMEGPLFAFLQGLVLLFLLQRRGWLLGFSLGLLAWARPEGYVSIALICLLLAADSAWRHLLVPDIREVQWRPLLRVFLPVSLLAGVWFAYNLAVNGTPYPNTYLVKHDFSLGYFNLENMRAVWDGYNSQLPFFASPLATVCSLLLFSAGALYTVQRLGWRALPVAFFPWTVWYALSLTMKWTGGPWLFWTRRYADPALPYFILVALLGAALLLRSSRGLAGRPGLPLRASRALALGGLAVSAVLVAIPLLGLPAQWVEYPKIFAWNSQNVEEVDSAAGRWVNDNVPPDATVATFDAGAMRYFGDRFTVDLSGLNFRPAIGRPQFDVVREFRPDYVFLFQSAVERSIPNAEPLLRLSTKRNTILGGSEAVLLKMDWTWRPDDKHIPKTLDTSNWQLLDEMDVGEMPALAGEQAHGYKDTATSSIADTWSKLAGSHSIADAGRLHPAGTTVSFSLRARAAKPLVLVLRYDALRQGNADVYVDDRLVGPWALRQGSFILGEDQFLIPADFVTANTVNVRLVLRGPLADYYYWSYTSP